MRSLRLSVLVLVLGSSSARAQAVQAVQPADVVGKWKGQVAVEGRLAADPKTGRKSCLVYGYGSRTGSTEVTCALKGSGILMLRPDSLWWEWQAERFDSRGSSIGWGVTGSGRWRLVGDSLWLATAPEYTMWASTQRGATSATDTAALSRLIKGSTSKADSLFWSKVELPKSDPLFWSKVSPTMIHKVMLTGRQLSLFSFDSLAKSPQAPAQGVYTRVDADSANGRHP